MEIFDKVSNHYPKGNCSSLQSATEYTKKLMVFLEDSNLLNENGIEALEDWDSNSQIDSTMLKEEGYQLLSLYNQRWNNTVRSVSQDQWEVNQYWNNRLNDMRTYNKAVVKNESSFNFETDNSYMDLHAFLECVDSNIPANARHILIECDLIDNEVIVSKIKTFDENFNTISNPILSTITENYNLFDFDKNNTILNNCKLIKEIWNESKRSYNYDLKIQPDRTNKQYFMVQ